MSVHQLIHQMTLRFKDPEASKVHNQGVVAAAAGKKTHVANTSKGNSRMGRNSPARPDVVTYTKAPPKPAVPTPSVAAPAPKVQAPKPKEAIKAPEISYSPEIQQAKERVTKYQDDVLSGKVSEDIYSFKQKPSDSQDKGNTSSKNNYLFDASDNIFGRKTFQ